VENTTENNVTTTYTEVDLGHKIVHIRKWKSKDRKAFKKIFTDKTDENTIDQKIVNTLVRTCVQEDVALTYEELQYILIKIRELSISPSFDFEYKCKKCNTNNKSTHEIKDIITFTSAPFEDITVDNLHLELQEIQNAKIYFEKSKQDEFDENMELAFHIKKINDKFAKFDDVVDMFDDMDVDKLDVILEQYNKMAFKLKNDKSFKCEDCGHIQKFEFDEIP
jgi:DNA-directed RNA polymerase subunit RPC12/RpoP